ncbi:hypothetical protein [Kibdelosporangium phytohabitans]|uniref:Uncharacterized protein n=1 Tax=Kibdelosporangium phytohabitans TaxID=860235 RepID=A0A0N9HTH1_9PSEU|nr:hypothetical protein [Kibdelosporangium phytohabitans]ALG06555.1 hypothetical protein AOZ06_06100 [Kibdelosporangium phytohabitans]MBE1467741.1 putative membrane protein [Kibdelosporangium phytohabitans]
MRMVIATVATVAGAAAVGYSTFLPWYRERQGRRIPLNELWNGVTATTTDMVNSLLPPLAVAIVLCLAGLVIGRRWMMALGAFVAVAVFAVFLGQQLQVEALASQFKQGFWNTAGGCVLLLVGAITRPAQRKSA